MGGNFEYKDGEPGRGGAWRGVLWTYREKLESYFLEFRERQTPVKTGVFSHSLCPFMPIFGAKMDKAHDKQNVEKTISNILTGFECKNLEIGQIEYGANCSRNSVATAIEDVTSKRSEYNE